MAAFDLICGFWRPFRTQPFYPHLNPGHRPGLCSVGPLGRDAADRWTRLSFVTQGIGLAAQRAAIRTLPPHSLLAFQPLQIRHPFLIFLQQLLPGNLAAFVGRGPSENRR